MQNARKSGDSKKRETESDHRYSQNSKCKRRKKNVKGVSQQTEQSHRRNKNLNK